MTAATPIFKLGEAFYVPDFKVTVGSSPIPNKVVRDIIEVSFTDEVNAIDSFEITLNNWDAAKQEFKYEPPPSGVERLFEPEHYLNLEMGYAGKDLVLMTRGIITTVEPNYPESGGPTLAIRGQNILHKYRRHEHSASWEGKGDSTIAQEIGKSPVSEDKPGLGEITVRIDEKRAKEEPREHVEMVTQHDIDFLLERARRRGYVLYVEEKGGKEQLYFGPSDQPARTEYALEWGLSLTSFRPTFSTAHQVSRVTVRGYNQGVGRARIEKSAQIPGDCDLNDDLVAPREAHKVITKPPPRSEDEARRMAIETLFEHRRKIVEASGATIGLPNLRAGSYITIGGFGERFSGRYFVTSTTHSIGSGGYTTSFKARREGRLPEKVI